MPRSNTYVPMDIFQIHGSSADLAPGKGVGESASPEKYKELRAIPNWRRILTNSATSPFPWKGKEWKSADHAIKASLQPDLFNELAMNSGSTLALSSGDELKVKEDVNSDLTKEVLEAKFAGNADARKALLLTQDAEIWFAPRGKKVRWTVLEGIRAAQRAPVVQTEMAEVPKKNSAKSKKPKNTSEVVEGVAITGLLPPTVDELPDMDVPEKHESAIRFCPVCRYYLYLNVSGEKQFRVCKNCGHNEEDTKGSLVMEMMIQERAAEGYKILLNEFTRSDPRLPHIRKNIKCPDASCKSNHGEAEPDVIYIKYDAIKMLYLYICDICGHQWRSAR